MSLRLQAADFELFCKRFEKEEDCINTLFDSKWPDGFRCPHCEHTQFYLTSTRRLPLYECRSCRTQTSLIVGTIMEGSRTPLRLWFQAIYLHTQPSCINALQLSTIICVTYKTAWSICHKIRFAMSSAESGQLLTGIVRVSDSVYCKRMSGSFDWHKQEQPLLIGTSDNEQGEIGFIKIKLQSKTTLRDKYDCPDTSPFISQHVDPQAAAHAIITRRYGRGMNKKLAWAGIYVTWWLGRLFRGIGPKHLQVYLDQYCYLQNREQSSLFDNLLKDCAITPRITYSSLIGTTSSTRSVRQAFSILSHSSQRSRRVG
jgi:hypothetical protein